MQWLAAAFFLSLLVVVHEFGHYIVAKWCGIRVKTFSIGFGPPILSWKPKETTFQICPILFGGYVWLEGMNVMEEVEPDDPRAYPNRPTWQRFLVILAGPLTNFLFAIVLAFGFYSWYGESTPDELLRVVSTQEGWDVHEKLLPGDTVLAVNGFSVKAIEDGKPTTHIADALQITGTSPATLSVLRDKKLLLIQVTPQIDESGKALLGVSYQPGDPEHGGLHHGKRRTLSTQEAAKAALLYPYTWSKRITLYLWDKLKKREKPELGSVVRMTKATKKALDGGGMELLPLLMYLNVSLGLFNLFPIPALDGGRLIFLGYELITRRRPNRKIEAYVTMFGVLLIFLLLILVTVNDIRTW